MNWIDSVFLNSFVRFLFLNCICLTFTQLQCTALRFRSSPTSAISKIKNHYKAIYRNPLGFLQKEFLLVLFDAAKIQLFFQLAIGGGKKCESKDAPSVSVFVELQIWLFGDLVSNPLRRCHSSSPYLCASLQAGGQNCIQLRILNCLVLLVGGRVVFPPIGGNGKGGYEKELRMNN